MSGGCWRGEGEWVCLHGYRCCNSTERVRQGWSLCQVVITFTSSATTAIAAAAATLGAAKAT